MKKTILKGLFLSSFLIYSACKKTNNPPASLPDLATELNQTWVNTTTHGTISVNGFPIAASESSNSTKTITVSFQKIGQYLFQSPLISTETGSFTLADSTIILASDSSYFANICSYPQIVFTSSPEIPALTLLHVQNKLGIAFISQDSLLLVSNQIKAGNNAPDTTITEFTGFRKP